MSRPPILALILALLPGAALAETIALTTPVYQDMPGSQARQLTARFEEGLKRAGADVVKSFGNDRGAEFVTSLVVARKGKELRLSALVTRVRRDTWAAREEAVAGNASDEAALQQVIDDLASRVAVATRNAPPRQAGAPPPPARAARLRARLEERGNQEKARAAEEAQARTFTNPQAAEEAQPAAEEEGQAEQP